MHIIWTETPPRRRQEWCRALALKLTHVVASCVLLVGVISHARSEEVVDTGWAVGKPPTLGPDVGRDESRSRFRINTSAVGGASPAGTRGAATGGNDLWRPNRAAETDGAGRIAQDYDWTSSALSDFSLQNAQPRQTAVAASPTNQRGLVVEVRPEEDEAEEGVEFRSPSRLPRQPSDSSKAASDGDKAHTSASGGSAMDARTPSGAGSATGGKRPDPENVTGAAPSPLTSDRPRRQDERPSADSRPLDSSELDRLLKSWDAVAREQSVTPQKATPDTPNEPRPFAPKSAGAANPIELPEERIELQPRTGPRASRESATTRAEADQGSPPATRSSQPVTRGADVPPRTQSTRAPAAAIEQRATEPERIPNAEALRPLTQNEKRLRDKVRNVLKMYYRRPLNSRDHDPWEMMHGMLAYGVHSRVLQNGPTGKPITAVGWLCYNKPCKQKTLLYTTPEGELRARWGVGVQGHYGQFLAMLAQCRVSRDYPIRVGSQEFTINDLIEAEKVTCRSGEELTFKLIALMHYCPSDERWIDDQGAEWDIRRLVREELQQPIRGAPCGGTHRLSGLALAARTRVKRGEPLDGEFREAHEFYKRYQRYAFQFQNPDGSLSTNWFRGAGSEEDINRRIKTSGHILEWLLYSLEDEELHDQRVFRAVNYVASLMANNYQHDWEIGPLCHATHALVIYDERLLQKYDGLEDAELPVAEQPGSRRSVRRSTRSNAR